jgi:integrase
MRLNEDAVKVLPPPASGHQIHYFPGAMIQGTAVPRGFGVRVTAAGVRSFVIRYRASHRERLFTIGQHPDWKVINAVREARTLRQRIDRGEDPLADRRAVEASAEDTFQAIAEEYQKREGGRLRSADWRKRTLERLVYPTLGAKQIGEIKRSEIVRLLDKIEDENGATMADRTLAVVRKIMNWHASRSDDFRSPIVRGMARTKPKEHARERTLTDDELRTVWRVAEASTGPFGRLVRFILLTAARRAEASALARGELDGADWTLPAARNKTKMDLVRPLSDAALAVLPEKVKGCDFLFSTDGRTPISGYSKFRRLFDNAILAELRKHDPQAKQLPRWTLHDLRRTARSLMSRAGVPSDHAERCLGHVMAGVRGTYDRHKYHDEKRQAFEKLAAQIERILNPPPANVRHLATRRQAVQARQ